jgi:predicted RND superfamily exporter protein
MSRLTMIGCRYPRVTLIALVAAAAWLAAGIRITDVRSIFEGDLPADDPIVADYDAFAARYPDRNFYVVGIETNHEDGIWNAATLTKIGEISAQAGLFEGAQSNVQSITTYKHVTGDDSGVRVEPIINTSRLTPDSIENARAVVRGDRLLNGRLVSTDERMALVRITFADGASPSVVHAAMEGLRTRYSGPERIVTFGREYANVEINKAVDENIARLFPLSAVLLLTFVYLCFGRGQAVLATATTILVSVLAFLGTMGRLGIAQTALSSSVPVVLVVAVGSSLVHILRRIYEESERGRPWPAAVEHALAHVGPGVWLAGGTTVVGFGSLLVFRIYSIQEFGVLAAVAVAIATVASLTWLPAFLLQFYRGPAREHHRLRRHLTRLVERLVELLVRLLANHRRTVLLSTVAVTIVAVAFASRLTLGESPARYFPVGHPVRDAFSTLLEHFGGDGFLFVEVTAPPGRTIYDPEFLRRVETFQATATELPHVGYASSVLDRVLMRFHRVMNGDQPDYEVVPPTREISASYAEVYRWSAPETLAEMVEDRDDPRRLIVDVFSEIEDSATIDATVAGLRAIANEQFPSEKEGSVVFGGEWFLWIAQNNYIVVGKLMNLISSIGMVGIVCAIALGSSRLAVLAVLPAAVSSLLVLGLMGAIRIPLNMTTCVLTSMVVGMGVDFAVHFLTRFDEIARKKPGRDCRADAVRACGPAILYSSISTIVAFSVCLASGLVPIRNFGWLICFSMFAAAATALLLLPALLPGPERSPRPAPEPLSDGSFA